MLDDRAQDLQQRPHRAHRDRPGVDEPHVARNTLSMTSPMGSSVPNAPLVRIGMILNEMTSRRKASRCRRSS